MLRVAQSAGGKAAQKRQAKLQAQSKGAEAAPAAPGGKATGEPTQAALYCTVLHLFAVPNVCMVLAQVIRESLTRGSTEVASVKAFILMTHGLPCVRLFRILRKSD